MDEKIDTQAAIAAAMMGAWRDPSEYADYVNNNADELVQVLCEVVPDEDGDYISVGDHAVGDRFASIGLRLLDERDEWPWDIAGWDMQQDCFVPARGFRVIGWQPLSPVDPSIPTDAMAALEAVKEQVREEDNERAARIVEALTVSPVRNQPEKWPDYLRSREHGDKLLAKRADEIRDMREVKL